MLDKLHALSDHGLAQLKEAVDTEMENRRRRLYAVGKLAKFENRGGEEVIIRITGRGPKNIMGEQVDEYGRLKTNAMGRPHRWRVHPTFLTPVVPKPLVKPATAATGGAW